MISIVISSCPAASPSSITASAEIISEVSVGSEGEPESWLAGVSAVGEALEFDAAPVLSFVHPETESAIARPVDQVLNRLLRVKFINGLLPCSTQETCRTSEI